LKTHPGVAFALLVGLPFIMAAWASCAPGVTAATDNEYAKHFGALSKLSVAVAEAMPADEYAFRPDP